MEMLDGNEPYSDNDCGELKMFKIRKSTCESRTLVYKFFRTTGPSSTEKCSPSLSDDSHPDFEDILRRSVSLSPSAFPSSEDSKLLSFDSEVSSEDVIDPNYPNIAEIPYTLPAKPKLYSLPIKSEGQELRRSLRLQALRSKTATSPKIPKQEEERISDSECKANIKVNNRKRQATVSKKRPSKIGRGTKKTKGGRGRKRGRTLDPGNLPKTEKCKEASCCSKQKKKIKTFAAKSGKPGPGGRMKLQSMLIVSPNTALSYPRKQDSYPKFANVDPLRVLSTLYHHRNSCEFASSRKPIALFFTKNGPLAPQTRGNRQCQFQRMQRDVRYLRQKYQMLDLMTLDNCYAISGYSLKRTEMMLLDLISGKEVAFKRDVDYEPFFPQPLVSESGFYVPQSFSRENLLSHKESLSSQNLNNYNSNKEFRTVFVQALKVLYCEEEESV